MAGQLRRPDVGFAAFYLVGGYTAGLMMTKLGWNYWMVLVVAAIHGAVWGLLRSVLTLWLRGVYFAAATFAFAGVLYVDRETWRSIHWSAGWESVRYSCADRLRV